jgi:hypothetical protein
LPPKANLGQPILPIPYPVSPTTRKANNYTKKPVEEANAGEVSTLDTPPFKGSEDFDPVILI